jgi:hypothetical protein
MGMAKGLSKFLDCHSLPFTTIQTNTNSNATKQFQNTNSCFSFHIYIFAVVNTSIPQEKKKRNCGDMEGTSSSSTTHDYHVEEIFPISEDEKYAEEIQLQEVLIFSAISNTNKEIEVVDVDEIDNVNNTLLRKLKLKEQETFEGESSSSSSSQLKQYSYCGICMETKSIEEMFENRNCSHSFCEECVGRYHCWC